MSKQRQQIGDIFLGITPTPTYFQTTCIATFPEVKANRGLLEIVSSERRPDGRYHISYGTKFKPWTNQEAVVKWIEDMRRQQKLSGKSLGITTCG